MSQRGRGCLEIRPSDSAFYRTTTSEIGDQHQPTRYDDSNDIEEEPSDKPESSSSTQSFAFLYTRESDKIGSMVRKDNMNNTMGASTGRRSQTRTRLLGNTGDLPASNEPVKATPGQLLASYKQGTKIEDPRFTTTSNEYGKKAPTIATFVSERSTRPQGFSKSFQNVNPKNTSLNTSMTKSNVHPNLDPQFG